MPFVRLALSYTVKVSIVINSHERCLTRFDAFYTTFIVRVVLVERTIVNFTVRKIIAHFIVQLLIVTALRDALVRVDELRLAAAVYANAHVIFYFKGQRALRNAHCNIILCQCVTFVVTFEDTVVVLLYRAHRTLRVINRVPLIALGDAFLVFTNRAVFFL